MEFKRSKISDLALNVTDGEHGSVIDDASGSYYLLSNKNIRDGKIIYDNSDRKINLQSFRHINRRTKLAKGDVVISTVGSIGRTAIIKDKNLCYDFQRSVGIIKPDTTKLTSEYLHYYLQLSSVQRRLNNLSKGAVQKCLFISDLNNIEIDYPVDVYDQKKIVSLLSILDSKIEHNNSITEELEVMAKTLYDYWFVQFDFPDANGKPYKSSGGKMCYNEVLKREVPEGWEVGKLSDIANITTGKLDSNAEVINGEYYFYTCAAEPSKTDSFAFDDDVILVAGNNAAGNFHINRYRGKFNAYQRTYVITAKNFMQLEYLYQILKVATKSFKSQGNGSQTKFLTIGMLTGIEIYSKCDLIENYFTVVNPFHEKQINIVYQNKQLSQLKEWLLPMLMNGQVKVGQAYESRYKSGQEVLSVAAEWEEKYDTKQHKLKSND